MVLKANRLTPLEHASDRGIYKLDILEMISDKIVTNFSGIARSAYKRKIHTSGISFVKSKNNEQNLTFFITR